MKFHNSALTFYICTSILAPPYSQNPCYRGHEIHNSGRRHSVLHYCDYNFAYMCNSRNKYFQKFKSFPLGSYEARVIHFTLYVLFTRKRHHTKFGGKKWPRSCWGEVIKWLGWHNYGDKKNKKTPECCKLLIFDR